MSISDAPEHTPASPEPAPIRYADEKPWQVLHPELAESILRGLYAEARPLFAYFHRKAMMGSTTESPPTKRQAQGAPDTQGR